MFIHQSRGSFRLIALVVLSVFSSSSLGVAYETEYSAPDANHNSGYMTKSMPSDMYAQSSANVESRVDTMNEVAEMNEMAEINSMDTPPTTTHW